MRKITEQFGNFNSKEFGAKQRSPREIELAKKLSDKTITEEEKGELYGIRAFPDNPRGQELVKKEYLGLLIPEEKGELYGIRAFPDNPRGQELVKKEYLGLLTPEEKEELRRLYQLKIRQETMTPELQKLWERTEANDPNVEQVSMNQGSSVEVSPDDEQEKVIWTYGLGGCFATLVFTEDENGRKTAVLTHFDPSSISANMNNLGRLIKANPAMKTAKYKQVLVLGPGGYVQNPETKQWEQKIRDQQKADMLITAIQTELGQDVEVKLEPYSLEQQNAIKDQGSLIVRIPPKGQATYRTWFSQGQLGKTDEHRISELREGLEKK